MSALCSTAPASSRPGVYKSASVGVAASFISRQLIVGCIHNHLPSLAVPPVSQFVISRDQRREMAKQKIVIKVSMPCEKCRAKAMALVARASGVSSMGVTGDGRDRLEVVGDGVDPVCLVKGLRKKIGPADILQVEEVKDKKPEEKKKPEEEPQVVQQLPYYHHPGYYYHYHLPAPWC